MHAMYLLLYIIYFIISVVHIALPNVSATPHDDRSLVVRWSSVVSSDLVGFIVEWRPLLNTDISLTQFELTDSNQTSLILEGMLYIHFSIFIQIPRTPKENMFLFCLHTLMACSFFLTHSIGSFEPYKPYEVSVYPRFKGGIGRNRTVFSYLRQKGELPDTERLTQTKDKDLKVEPT